MTARDADDHCAILFDWLDLIIARVNEDNAPVHLQRIANVAGDIRIAVLKSSYLGRRLYGDEAHRERACPMHKGRWSGLPTPETDCPHGCQLTGWLPETGQTGMCPHCGAIVVVLHSLTVQHAYRGKAYCEGSLQNPRNPQSDIRDLWNGEPSPARKPDDG